MRAFEPRVIDAVFTALESLLPPRPVDDHPLGLSPAPDRRPGVFHRDAVTAGHGLFLAGRGPVCRRLGNDLAPSAGRMGRCGVFERLVEEAIAAYDRICGLDLSEVAVDGSLHKAPCGGEGTGPNPTDRGKRGWKWSLVTERAGVPIGWAVDGANRHDIPLLDPTLAAVATRGLLIDLETLHLDRGYDANTVRTTLTGYGIDDAIIFEKRRRGDPQPAGRLAPLGLRWSVERTNSWLSNYGQRRRNTDRFTHHRLAQLALAIVLTITVKLIDIADRYHH